MLFWWIENEFKRSWISSYSIEKIECFTRHCSTPWYSISFCMNISIFDIKNILKWHVVPRDGTMFNPGKTVWKRGNISIKSTFIFTFEILFHENILKYHLIRIGIQINQNVSNLPKFQHFKLTYLKSQFTFELYCKSIQCNGGHVVTQVDNTHCTGKHSSKVYFKLFKNTKIDIFAIILIK